jgi:hypothetical protein
MSAGAGAGSGSGSGFGSGFGYGSGSGAAAAAAPTGIHAIFFDNDAKHIAEVQVCPRIHCVKVPGTPWVPPKGLPPNISLSIPAFASHRDGVPDFFVTAVTGGTQKDRFDPGSGFGGPHLEVLNDWIRAGKDLKADRFAIFDFDRTITQIEGFATPPDDSGFKGIGGFNEYIAQYGIAPMTVEMYMTYLCGSDRLALLRAAFDMCRAHRINIVVLTNNGACINDPLIMQDFMSVFGLSPRDFSLLCSLPYGGDKKRTLEENIAGITATAGGGKKRTRKQRSQKKKTLRKKLRK